MDSAEDAGFVQLRAESYLPNQRVFACEPGTFALPVADVDHTMSVLGLVLLDSGDYARSGGYGSPSAAALQFLAEVPKAMRAQSQEIGRSQEPAVPCMVFQHFPVQQYYQLLKPAAANAARAIEGYRNFAGKHYVLDEEKTLPGSYLGEGVSCPDADSGESRYWNSMTILRFPRDMITATHSLEQCRFREKWPRLMRRRRLRQARLAV